jgi:hypothetical protein
MRDGLQALAGKLGKPDLYHETVTVAFMALVAQRKPADGDWDSFIARHPELCERGLLDGWYSTSAAGLERRAQDLRHAGPDWRRHG